MHGSMGHDQCDNAESDAAAVVAAAEPAVQAAPPTA
jgi:hypothetical protein